MFCFVLSLRCVKRIIIGVKLKKKNDKLTQIALFVTSFVKQLLSLFFKAYIVRRVFTLRGEKKFTIINFSSQTSKSALSLITALVIPII